MPLRRDRDLDLAVVQAEFSTLVADLGGHTFVQVALARVFSTALDRLVARRRAQPALSRGLAYMGFLSATPAEFTGAMIEVESLVRRDLPPALRSAPVHGGWLSVHSDDLLFETAQAGLVLAAASRPASTTRWVSRPAAGRLAGEPDPGGGRLLRVRWRGQAADLDHVPQASRPRVSAPRGDGRDRLPGATADRSPGTRRDDGRPAAPAQDLVHGLEVQKPPHRLSLCGPSRPSAKMEGRLESAMSGRNTDMSAMPDDRDPRHSPSKRDTIAIQEDECVGMGVCLAGREPPSSRPPEAVREPL